MSRSTLGDMGTEDLDALEFNAQMRDDEDRLRKMPGAARKVIDHWYASSAPMTQHESEKMDELVEELAMLVGALS